MVAKIDFVRHAAQKLYLIMTIDVVGGGDSSEKARNEQQSHSYRQKSHKSCLMCVICTFISNFPSSNKNHRRIEQKSRSNRAHLLCAFQRKKSQSLDLIARIIEMMFNFCHNHNYAKANNLCKTCYGHLGKHRCGEY